MSEKEPEREAAEPEKKIPGSQRAEREAQGRTPYSREKPRAANWRPWGSASAAGAGEKADREREDQRTPSGGPSADSG
jgi:hypothetical protein